MVFPFQVDLPGGQRLRDIPVRLETDRAGVLQVSIAVDTYFPRAHLIECLRSLQADFPTVAINLRITTMQGGERLVLEGTCALAVMITDVPELSPRTLEGSIYVTSKWSPSVRHRTR